MNQKRTLLMNIVRNAYITILIIIIIIPFGDAPYCGLYVEAPPEKGTLFRL